MTPGAFFRLVYIVPAMVKPVFCIVPGYPPRCCPDDIFQQVTGAGPGRVQPSFKLAEGQLDGVKIRQIGGQLQQQRPVFLHYLVLTRHFVHR